MAAGSQRRIRIYERDGNSKIGIVTHADRDWTWRKYQWLELEKYLEWDNVYTIDTREHKTAEKWGEAISYFSIRPKNCAVVGDSPRSDINPADEIGVKELFMVEDPDQWSLHKQAVPPRTRVIANLNQIREVGREVRR